MNINEIYEALISTLSLMGQDAIHNGENPIFVVHPQFNNFDYYVKLEESEKGVELVLEFDDMMTDVVGVRRVLDSTKLIKSNKKYDTTVEFYMYIVYSELMIELIKKLNDDENGFEPNFRRGLK